MRYSDATATKYPHNVLLRPPHPTAAVDGLPRFFPISQPPPSPVPWLVFFIQLLEVFGTGTAAVISPVNGIKYREHDIEVRPVGCGPLKPRSIALLVCLSLVFLFLVVVEGAHVYIAVCCYRFRSRTRQHVRRRVRGM